MLATLDRLPVPRVVTASLCTVLQICFGTVYAWSFFQTLLVRQLGWTFTETAWAFSITIFSLGTSAAWAGAVLPKMGPRKLALAGSVMFSVGYLIASLALRWETLALFYLGYGVIGGAGIGLGYVTPVATVAKWFPDRKGLATGVVVMGFGVGAFLLSKVLAPVLVWQSENDLPTVFLSLGVIFACILIPSSLLLRDPPQEHAAQVGGGDVDDIPLRNCLESREFVVMWTVFFFNIAAGIAVISFQSPLLQDVWGLADPTVEPGNAGRIRCHADRRELSVQRCWAFAVGAALGSLRARAGVPYSAREPNGGVRHPDDRARPVDLLRAGVLRAALLWWRLCHHAFLCVGRIRLAPDVHRVWRHAHGVGGGWHLRAALCGPLKDQYPDRAVIYCFLIGILILGLGYVCTYLLNDDRLRVGRPTLASTLRELGISPRSASI